MTTSEAEYWKGRAESAWRVLDDQAAYIIVLRNEKNRLLEALTFLAFDARTGEGGVYFQAVARKTLETNPQTESEEG